MSEEQEYKQLSQLEHVKLRPNTYIGSISVQPIDMYCLDDDDKFIMSKIEYSPGCLKIIDEICVNAVDHFTRNPKKVKNIDISFDEKKGIIAVRNDGPGIPIKMVDTLNDGKKYQPEAIFSQFLSGSNFSSEERIVGGMNGIGAKAANAFSKVFKVETVYKNKYYVQRFRNQLEIIEPPEIKTAVEIPDYTKITFIPAYKALGYKKYDENIAENLYKLIKARAYQIAAFIGNKCTVRFNDKIIYFDDFAAFASKFLNNNGDIYKTVLNNPEDKKLYLEICIGISDGKFRSVSLINGINVFMGGSHIKHIQNEIVNGLRDKVEKELNKTREKNNKTSEKIVSNLILNQIFIFVRGNVLNPEFNSQSKEKLTTSIEKFKDYKFKPVQLRDIWNIIEPYVLESFLGKVKDKKQNKVNRGTIILDKGEDAKWAGDKKKAQECTLVICEGDSALGMVTRGINHKKTSLVKEYYGTFSIQGVPINARKEIHEVINKKDGSIHRIRNDKLKNNKRFTELVKLLGLDYEKTYDIKTDDGREEFKTLRYGRVVIAVDQDEDGKGQIFGLIVNFLLLFWPKLAEWNYIKRFNTPIIRAYPNDKNKIVKEFCTLYTFKRWIQDEFKGNDEISAKMYKIKYYKGLASHDVGEIKPMFNHFEKKLYTYDFDENAEKSLEIYYGKETTHRKKALSSPVAEEDEIKEENNVRIPVSLLMRTDVKEFQRDNIMRKLPHIMDGMVPARRKAFYTARDVFKTTNAKEIKVCNFTGMVISKTNYHHGDASLSETIIKMAQSFIGARNLPLLIGVGEFGSRLMGGKDHGQPRYVYVKLNQKLTDVLYPRIDDFLLPYQFDEGDRCEPTYYVPIIPTSILESMVIPATGWKAEIWARNYKDVLRNVRAMIKGEITRCKYLDIWMRGNNCDVRHGSDGNVYVVGKYKYKSPILTVTELPPGVYNENYKNSVAYTTDKEGKKELRPEFKSVSDCSNYDEETNLDEIKIDFELNDGVMDEWKKTQNNNGGIYNIIEDKMNLYLKINSHINMICADGTVREYKFYSSIVNEWFVMRKKIYQERVERMTVLTKLMIRYLKNIIRFTKERDGYNITNKTPEKRFNEILKEQNYDTFNKGLLFSPKYTSINDLENLIINNTGAGTSYEYIITLTYRQLLEEACERRNQELKKEEDFLKEILNDSFTDGNNFKGKRAWLKEIDALEKIIEEGVAKGWSYTKDRPKFI